MAFIKNIQGARITGSITASFSGDGSGLTGIVSASNADTASYVDLVAGTNITINQVGTTYTINSTGGGGGGGDTFPYTGSAIISGSLQVTGSVDISSTLTAAGITYPTTDGDDGDIIFTDGAGNLSFGRTTVFATVKNITSGTLQKGTPVHVTGSVGNTSEVVPASASVALTMPAHFILNEDLTAGSEGKAIAAGFINGVNTSGFIEGDTVYVGAEGGYTNQKPTGSNLIQNLGIVDKIHATNGSGFILGAGRSNDVPNITQGYVWVGNSDGVATPTATSSIQNVISSSYATTASYAISASYEINYETSSSYAETASYVPTGVGGLYGGNGTIPLNTTASVNGDLLFQGLDEDTRLIVKDGNGGSAIHLFSDGNQGQSAIEFRTPTANTLLHKIEQSGGDTRFISNNRDLVFSTNTSVSTEGFFIQAGTGNMGIGTTSPEYKLDIVGDAGTSNFEDVVRVGVSDTADSFVITNGVSTDGTFAPVLRSYQTSSTQPFFIQGTIATAVDTGTNSVIRIQGRVSGSGWEDVTNRPIVQFLNNATRLMTIAANGNVGIGTDTPSEIFEVVQNTEKFKLDLDDTLGPEVVLYTPQTDKYSKLIISDGVNALSMGTLGSAWTGSTVYGNPGDSSIYSNTSANGVNIISAPGTGTEDYIRLYAGGNPFTSNASIHIHGSGSTKGNVGIGTETPTSKLEVVGSFNLREFGGISTVTGNTAGWYRIGYTSGGDRGGIRVVVSYAGGNWTPTTYVINTFKNWSSSAATLQLEKYGQSNYITEVRIVEDEVDSTTYHLEVYLQSLTAGHNARIYFDKNLGYEGIWNLNTGVLSASTSVANPVARSPFTSTSDGYTFENIVLNNNINNNFWKLEDGDGFLYFKDSNSDTPLTLQAEDNFVGINNTSPLVELDVSGDTKISGSLTVTAGITGSLQGTASFADNVLFTPGTGTNSSQRKDSLNTTAGNYSTTLGNNNTGSGNYSLVSGLDNTNSGGSSTLSGFTLSNTGLYSALFGRDNISTNNYTFLAGRQNTVSGRYAGAVGFNHNSTGESSFAAGQSNDVDGSYSVALGYNNVTTNVASFAVGFENSASIAYSVSAGYRNTVTGSAIGGVALGTNNIVSGDRAVALGRQNTSNGSRSFSSGFRNLSSNNQTFAHGYLNTASVQYAVAIGRENVSAGIGSIALGYLNYLATGSYSFAAGYDNNIVPSYAGAIGYQNTILSTYGMAFGALNQAGNYAVAAGYNNDASGIYSVALGGSNTASGNGAVALGTTNQSLGSRSIVAGYLNTASADHSVAIGRELKATALYSSVVGGRLNNADAVYSGIFAGVNNNIPAAGYSGSVILGGDNNVNSGSYSAIVGGRNNTIGAGGNNVILGGTNIDSGDNSNTVFVPNFYATGSVQAPNLANTETNEILYYNTSSGAFTYGDIPAPTVVPDATKVFSWFMNVT